MGTSDYGLYEGDPVRPEDQAGKIARVMDFAAMDEEDPRLNEALTQTTNLEARYALKAAIDQARAALARQGFSHETFSPSNTGWDR